MFVSISFQGLCCFPPLPPEVQILHQTSRAMSAVIPSRLAALTRLRCQIFETAYNPTGLRTGAKYLRARLRGPSMVKYYPPEINITQLASQFPELELVDDKEIQRLQDVEDRKKRGKGAPKKAKTKGTPIQIYIYSEIMAELTLSSQLTVEERIGNGRSHLDTALLYIHVQGHIIPHFLMGSSTGSFVFATRVLMSEELVGKLYPGQALTRTADASYSKCSNRCAPNM